MPRKTASYSPPVFLFFQVVSSNANANLFQMRLNTFVSNKEINIDNIFKWSLLIKTILVNPSNKIDAIKCIFRKKSLFHCLLSQHHLDSFSICTEPIQKKMKKTDAYFFANRDILLICLVAFTMCQRINSHLCVNGVSSTITKISLSIH